MKYKAILFDLDGTLADTSRGIYNCIIHTQRTLKLPLISEEQMRTHIGPSPEDSFKRSFGLHGEQLQQTMVIYKQYAMEKGLYEAVMYSGIKELLHYLKQDGCKLCVVTLKNEDVAIEMLRYFQLIDYFDIIGGAHVDRHDKKSALINNCINILGIEKSGCVLIGDSEYDAVGAEEAGIDFIGVTYGFGFKTVEDVMKYRNIGYANSVEALRSIFTDV
jgi:phosphoglycolate phosphatase